ncbi:hypothetical protein [Agrobacterium vitis]|uniref:hypothetical protein n=1 Tax=Agrobacterium vitis TaxID=373 RepID=UPI0015724501|nr:hypothetical protein [Agrobacterium vitis]NSZ52965.1 hypothetical protein [Agrobacterium vitis]NTA31724.1 hypothetical protein [Agrobacterium vitis]
MKICYKEITAALCILYLTNYNAEAASDCDAILEQGVRNTYQKVDATNLQSKISNSLCSSYSKSSGSKGGGGLSVGIPIDGVPLTFGGNYSKTDLENIASQSCKNDSSSLSDDQYHKVLSMVADARIVEAWSKCKSQSGGLLLNAEAHGSNIIFSVRFRPLGNTYQTRLTDDPIFDGVQCNKNKLKSGSTIGNPEINFICKRTNDEEVTAIINAEDDAARIFVPAVAKPEAPRNQTPGIQSIDPIFPPRVVIFECRVNRNALNLPVTAPQPNCSTVSKEGEPCSCPIFDGKGGSWPAPGVSYMPSDAFWAAISPTMPHAIRPN